jgi:hypothetical protein
MQLAVLNRAAVEVANTTDVSGRVTADSIKDGLYAKKQSSLWRIFGLTIFGSVVSVGVFAFLAPIPALADAGGVPAEIAALQAQVAALQSTVATLQTSNSALQTQINTLQTQLAAVQNNPALALGPFVSVDSNPENGVAGPNIKFTGANIHILSGSGATDDNLSTGGSLTGLGNLIIGYDEALYLTGNRGGSHNLVIGRYHTFTSSAFGGLVAGEVNTISNEAASVSGYDNTASGKFSSISGGEQGIASGASSSVSGGYRNTANQLDSSVSGGGQNTASNVGANVTGGFNNTASGNSSLVIGGSGVTASADDSIRPQPPFAP